jgi:hypothetical protein
VAADEPGGSGDEGSTRGQSSGASG